MENQYGDLWVAYNRIQNKPTVLKFLKIFDSENILNGLFVNRVLEGQESSESIVPRAESMLSLGDILFQYVSNVLG